MKRRLMRFLPFSFVALLFLGSEHAGLTAPVMRWGATTQEIVGALPADSRTSSFNPRDVKDYNNKIMGYITAIDERIVEKVSITRVQGEPEVDYLFISNNLYSVMEDYKEIDLETGKKIQSELCKQYGNATLQQDENLYIYSMYNETTKVLFYMLKVPGDRCKCKTYYYTKKLFRMLMLNN